jgi:hypothetical protein
MRVRKGSSTWCSGGVYQEAYRWVGVHDFPAGGERVILPSISCQCKNDASHRNNGVVVGSHTPMDMQIFTVHRPLSRTKAARRRNS